jgi:outer membrane protein assembly factor BamA
MNVEAFRPLVLQKEDEPYSTEKIQGTAAALQRTGQFSKIETEVKLDPRGLRVTFVMQPAYYVGMVYFPGALKTFSYPRLLQVVNYPAQEPYEESRLKAAEPALQGFFTNNGYFVTRVEGESKLDEAHQLADLVFHITLGRQAKFGRIEIAGLPAKDADSLQHALGSFRARLKGASLKPGKSYDPERIQRASAFIRDYLSKQNRLASQVHLQPPNYDPETNRADLIFRVTLGPEVFVRVAGAHVSNKTLRKLVPVYEESAFDRDLVEEGRRNLVSYFQSKGYFDVKVTSQTHESAQVSIVYQIEKGDRHRVPNVNTAGNRHFDKEELMDQVVVQKGRFFSRGKFDQHLLNRSVENLTAFYRNAGFADVQVQPDVVDREHQVNVTFKITEGEPTLVESLHVEGNKTRTVDTLVPNGLKLKPGEPYSRSRLDEDRNQVVASYLNLGYPNVDFKSIVKPVADNPHRVAVSYLIEEGQQVHVDQVAYLGSEHTQQSLLRRNTGVEQAGPLSAGKLLESESNLLNLGIFDWANVSPRKPITDQQQEEVLVRVHEAKRNSFTYGLGIESTPRTGSLAAGVVALPGLPAIGLPPSFEVIQKTIISPLGSIEYSRLNMRGRAETASLATFLSRLDQRASFSYLIPQFRDLNWNALWSFSVERTTQNPLFTARLGQGSFQIERILDAAKTKRLQFRYTYQRTALTHLLIQNFIPPGDESVRSSTLSAAFVRDTRDNPLDAHKGSFQTVDFGIGPKLIGSSQNVARFFGQTAYYWQLKPWMVWANSVRVGLVESFAGGHVPISQLFFSGGSDSLRGFPLNGAGPQRTAVLCTQENDPSSCTAFTLVPTGGHQLFVFNSEGRFPIPLRKGLGGVVFYDGGNVYNNIGFSRFFSGYSNTVGLGLRYQTPVGPIRIDIGHNLNPVPGFNSTQIFVSLGQAF